MSSAIFDFEDILAVCGADSGDFVGHHTGSDTDSVDHDAAPGFLLCDGLCDLVGEVGVVDGVGGVGTEVEGGVVPLEEGGFDFFFEVVSSVVGA